MARLKDIKIRVRLVIGFGIILLLSLTLGSFAYFKINNLWEGTKSLYEHPFTVSNAVRDIKTGIVTIHRDMKDVVLTKEKKDLEQLVKGIDRQEEIVYKKFEIVFDKYLGDTNDILSTYNSFKDWKYIRDKVIKLRLEGRYDEAAQITRGEGYQHIKNLLDNVQVLLNFAENKADSFYNRAKKEYRKSVKISILILIVSMFVGITSSFLITQSITKPLNKLLEGITSARQGNLDYNLKISSNDEIGEFSKNFAELTKSLKITKEDTEKKISYLNNIPAPVHVVDKDLNVLFINKAGSEFLKKDIHQCIGKKCYNLFNTEHCRNKNCCAEKAMSYNSNFNSETTCNPFDNANIPIRYLSSPLKNNDGQIIGAIEYILDITDEAKIIAMAEEISKGNYNVKIEKRNQDDRLVTVLNSMTESLKAFVKDNDKRNWIKTGQTELNIALRGDREVSEIANNVISFIATYLYAQVGAIFIKLPEEDEYKLNATYAYQSGKSLKNSYKIGEGVVGQAALEKKLISITDIPSDYIRVDSSLGESLPKNIVILPLVHNNEAVGVIELGSLKEFSKDAIEFLEVVQENIAISISTASNRTRMKVLLTRTQEQAEELQVQQEELRQANMEMEEQAKVLKKSEENLQAQQEELRVTNEELQQQTNNLEQQKAQMQLKNNELENTRNEIEKKARQLEITGKYKSEFLANMSHELRTPLNSLLLLALDLSENSNGNLSEKQVEAARIIYKSGSDLLNLINEILDLSKIESGKLQLDITEISLHDLINNINLYFNHVIKQKGLDFTIHISKALPDRIETDSKRLEQIIRNFVSNAVKFTESGEIKIEVRRPRKEELANLSYTIEQAFVIAVIDTGIGVEEDKLSEIFEAFHQIDGSISRKYDGTGLGLSISKELTKLLQGEIKVKSKIGKGSEFMVILPVIYKKQDKENSIFLGESGEAQQISSLYSTEKSNEKIRPLIESIPDDREIIKPEDSVILIIEDDKVFAKSVYDLCRSKDFKCIATATGEQGLELAEEYNPQGIILDINLPGADGWNILDKLKKNSGTRHIPVHIISSDDEAPDAYAKGAIGYFTKPVTKEKLEHAFSNLQSFIDRKMKDLLLIEDNNNQRLAIKALLGTKDIHIDECTNGKEAFDMIKNHSYDCAILDLGLPDISGFNLLHSLEKADINVPPIVVYTGKELTTDENDKLQKYASTIIIKGVRSQERLLDETSLFLHRVIDEMPTRQKMILTNLYNKDIMFKDKKVLVVDDDMRNVFAITQLLEKSHMKVIMANNGQKALELLESNLDINLILMDIMMPVLDGYGAMRKIRKKPKYKDIPIIAITAKAMKEDRQKCIEAGANDYISKPVDTEKLFNLIRVWLYQ